MLFNSKIGTTQNFWAGIPEIGAEIEFHGPEYTGVLIDQQEIIPLVQNETQPQTTLVYGRESEVCDKIELLDHCFGICNQPDVMLSKHTGPNETPP